MVTGKRMPEKMLMEKEMTGRTAEEEVGEIAEEEVGEIAEKVREVRWQNRRILGLDYGDKRIGVAISDELQSLAFPLTVLESHRAFDKLLEIINKNSVVLVVVGLPISINGAENSQSAKVRKFVDKLLSIRKIDIVFFDERLSTMESMQYINEARLSWAKQKKTRDKVSASIILQDFLNKKAISDEELKNPQFSS
ncbi:MAG: Holliday junction resolvase RuvX [Holosporales bacterium]|jgi:putative Holliday junction resolvase|nr:Holliday junction resolvase RuvX [Holosporales bacterium]